MVNIKALKGKNVGFIGSGNMATAIIKGLITSKAIKNSKIYISDKDSNKRTKVARALKIKVTDNNKELVSKSDIVILAVKPQDIKKVLGEIKDSLYKKKIIISIVAGITTKYIQRFASKDVDIVRAMPNIGCLRQISVTAIALKKNINKQTKDAVRAIFHAVGAIEEVSEGDMDVVTALSGSGPAYIAYFIDSLIKASQSEGLSRAKAESLALQTALGSILLLREKNMQLEDLINKVASKGGTTAAALKIFDKYKLNEILAKAIKAATKRSRELSRT